MTTDKELLIEELLRYAENFLGLDARDEIYVRNFLLREFCLKKPLAVKPDFSYIDGLSVPDELFSKVAAAAKETGKAEEGAEELYATYIFGCLSPLPSVVADKFYSIKENEGIEKACEYFYNLSVMNNYVQKTAIGKNLKWDYADGERSLEITVNLSKPEKDNRQIAKLVKAPAGDKYPACQLCKENVGFEGHSSHPARGNLRTVPLTLGGESWFVQYSPYGYFDEHIIAVSDKHVPMHIGGDTVEKLFDFIDYFPNYIVGSNAALPIIGGSILNHEHFQGGRHLMPMQKAPVRIRLTSDKFTSVRAGVVDWYNNVVRIESEDRSELSALAKIIIDEWETFSDEASGIFAESGGVRHNSLSPIARKADGRYILDMILRNNITSEKYPDGVFHAHPEYHNIKKEGIGLIEAMGLFILPGRLKKQLNAVAEILAGTAVWDRKAAENPENPLYVHRFMIDELLKNGLSPDFESAYGRVKDKVNDVCRNILLNTAVFKDDRAGQAGFAKFLRACGLK